MSSPSGWYADPERAGGLRFWDGEQWTDARAGTGATLPPGADSGKRPRAPVSRSHYVVMVLAFLGVAVVLQLGFNAYSWFTHPLAFPCCQAVPTYSATRDVTVEVPLTLNVGAVPKRAVTITSITAMTYPSRFGTAISYTLCDATPGSNTDPNPVACGNPRDPVGQLITPGENVLLVHIVAHEAGTLVIHGTLINYREGRWRHGSQVTGGAVTVNALPTGNSTN